MNILNIFILFVIYSFLGWAVETIYCSTLQGRFIYRGFLNGPVCPVYGFGALFVLGILNNLKIHPILLFFASIFITSVLEYITSYLLEKLFNMKWWDYSEKKYNINGRVCLLNSTLFGLLSLFLIEVLHPKVISFLSRFTELSLNISSLVFFLYFLLDITITVGNLLNLKPYLRFFDEYEKYIFSKDNLRVYKRNLKKKYTYKKDNLIKDIKEKSSIHKEVRDNRLKAFKVNFSNRRIVHAYPNLVAKNHPKAIDNLKRHIKDIKNKDKQKNS